MATRKSVIVVKIVIGLIPVGFAFFLINQRFLIFQQTQTWRPGQFNTAVRVSDGSVIRSAQWRSEWVMADGGLPTSIRVGRYPKDVSIRYAVEPPVNSIVTVTAAAPRGQNSITRIIDGGALDDLTWPKVSQGGITIWDANRSTADTSLGWNQGIQAMSKPSSAVVGLHPYSFTKIDRYQADGIRRTLKHTLRGSMTMEMYAGQETLHLDFWATELHRTPGSDAITIRVASAAQLRQSGNTWIKQVTYPQLGDGSDQQPSKPRHIVLDVPVSDAGVYVVMVETSDDVIMNELTTTQRYVQFENKVFFADGSAYPNNSPLTPVKVISSGSINVAQMHAQGKQNVTIAGQTKQLEKDRIGVTFTNVPVNTTFTLNKPDATIASTGAITLEPFSPLPIGAAVVTLDGKFSISGYTALAADYVPNVSNISDWQTFSFADFVVDKEHRIHLTLRVIQQKSSPITVDHITVRQTPQPLTWQKIWQRVKKLL